MIPVDLLGLQVEATAGLPMVLLREIDAPGRVLPIFIGTPEAMSIAMSMEGLVSPRPTTHDLMIEVMSATGIELERVDLTAVHDGTFDAELVLSGPDGSQRIEARPSDAIALAVRVGAPLFAAEEVLAEAGAVLEEIDDDAAADADVVDVEAEVEQFRDFLAELTAEDFAEPSDASPGVDTDTDPDIDTDPDTDTDTVA